MIEISPKIKNENSVPLRHYWNDFVNALTTKGRSDCTIRNANDALNVVERHLDIKTIEDCNDPELLDEKLLEFQELRNFSRTTFNSYLKNINTYFIWLKSRGYILQNNVSIIARAKQDQKEQPTLTNEQVQRVVGLLNTRKQSRLERYRNKFFIDLLRFTGARLIEILQLQMKDITNENGVFKLTIQGKKQKGRPRYYTLVSYIRDSYQDYITYRERLGRMETSLFISSSKLTGWTDKGVRGLLKRLSTELRFKVTAYSFRRYVATTMCNNNAQPLEMMQFLGHSRLSTTLGYVKRSTELTKAGVEIMSKFL